MAQGGERTECRTVHIFKFRTKFLVLMAICGVDVGVLFVCFVVDRALDPNQTRGVGGTGLGLYVSSELVRRMNGRLWVESREGEGSRFYVDLPLDESGGPADVLAHLS